MKRSGPPARRTPLSPGDKPLKRSPISRTVTSDGRYTVTRFDGPVPDKPRRARKGHGIPAESRAAVMRRSRGWCELRLPGCQGDAATMHHRKLRRAGDHRPVNLLDLCAACHRWVHDHTGYSYARGWLVRQSDDPAAVAVMPGEGPRLPPEARK